MPNTPLFLVFFISDRQPSDVRFEGTTLEKMVKDQDGIIVAENLSSFTEGKETAWAARKIMRRIQLFLLDFEYLVNWKTKVGDESRLARYLAGIFCYGGACSLEKIIDGTCETRVAIISDKKSSAETNVFPPFASWVHDPFLVERIRIPISDPNFITLIIQGVRQRVVGKRRAEDGDRKLRSFEGDSD